MNWSSYAWPHLQGTSRTKDTGPAQPHPQTPGSFQAIKPSAASIIKSITEKLRLVLRIRLYAAHLGAPTGIMPTCHCLLQPPLARAKVRAKWGVVVRICAMRSFVGGRLKDLKASSRGQGYAPACSCCRNSEDTVERCARTSPAKRNPSDYSGSGTALGLFADKGELRTDGGEPEALQTRASHLIWYSSTPVLCVQGGMGHAPHLFL